MLMKKPETMEPTYRIYHGITFGAGAVNGDYVVVGVPPRGREPGEMATTQGVGAVLRSHTVLCAGNVRGINFQTGHGALERGGSVTSEKGRG